MTDISSSQSSVSTAKPVKGIDFWLAVYECMQGNPKIDFEKLAEKCGYKNAITASVTFHKKRKAAQRGDAPASPTKRTDAAADGTKAKRGRKPKVVKDEDGEPVKKRGRGRPKKSEVNLLPPIKFNGSEVEDGEASTEYDE